MSDKKRYPLTEAQSVAVQLQHVLRRACERVEIAGSIRRRRPEVGDIEILYVPIMSTRPKDLLETERYNLVDAVIEGWVTAGVLAKRRNVNGSQTWGEKNKLAVHIATGIPVDFFATTAQNWWNSLVCRTGGKQNNLLITTKALQQGWHFEAYGAGYRRCDGSGRHDTTSERDVFEFIGLTYLEPQDRP